MKRSHLLLKPHVQCHRYDTRHSGNVTERPTQMADSTMRGVAVPSQAKCPSRGRSWRASAASSLSFAGPGRADLQRAPPPAATIPVTLYNAHRLPRAGRNAATGPSATRRKCYHRTCTARRGAARRWPSGRVASVRRHLLISSRAAFPEQAVPAPIARVLPAPCLP